MITLENRKQLDDLICDEVNIKALNRVMGMSEKGEIELQYVRRLRRYNWRLDGNWVKDADEKIVEQLLTTC